MGNLTLKILVISANYPPDHLGGYELRIKDIMDGLAQRGHNVRVLTTKKLNKVNLKPQKQQYPVLRKLHNRYNARFFPKEVLFDLMDTQFVDQQTTAFQPDLIYLGHIYILSKALLPFLADLNIPLVLDEGGASLKGAWTERGRWFRFTGDYRSRYKFLNKIKPFVIKSIIKLSNKRIQKSWRWPKNLHVIFNNFSNCEKALALGMPVKSSRVIHSGINIKKFTFLPRERVEIPVRIIYPARIEPLKGQVDAVQLVESLSNSGVESRLVLVGPIHSNKYFEELSKEISQSGFEDTISYLPMINQNDLVKLYHQSDMLFFPTYHKMGFSRIPLEAMACGCVMISYGNEGSNEILLHEQNGFVVQESNVNEVVNIIQKLSANPELVKGIVTSARKEIEENYSLPAYVNRIENTLISVINSNSL